MWQWWNYYMAQLPAGKVPLRINLDETSICLFQGHSKGTILVDKRRPRPFQNVSRSKRRRCLTHVAFACDRTDLQAVMPQVLIGNEATFLVSELPVLMAASPANVHLMRQKSAWNNGQTCASIVRLLGRALKRHAGAELQPILLLDAVRLHTTPQVLAACRATGIWPILVPAKMTWLLQPLDTDAFLPFKTHLQKVFQNARARSLNGDLPIREFLQCVFDAVRHVLQGHCWAAAFDRNGFGFSQARVSAHVLRHLELEPPVCALATRPSVDQLRCCFPKRSTVPAAALWRPFDGPPVAAALSGSSAHRMVPRAWAEPPVREPRTRAEHRRAEEAAAAEYVGPAAATDLYPRALGLPPSTIPMLD